MAQITSGRVGILADQNMFEAGASREGILDARRSFIRMINTVFARNPVAFLRPDAVASLDAETPLTEYLMWRQETGSRYVQPIPPQTEYDIMVYTIDERDDLLNDAEFVDRLSVESVRVLVNGLANVVPQWSVWVADAPEAGIDDTTDPETVFSLAKTYDFPMFGEEALTKNQRNLLLQTEEDFTRGSRVLVQGDASTSGFWTIWQYNPEVGGADENGFTLLRTQTFRTRDFWEYVDWYAEGYSASQPPVVSYPTAGARNAVENPVPSTTFVKVEDDGYGRWAWTAFSNGAWNIVARERGTVQLSDKLYDPSREVLFEPQAPAPSIDKLRRVSLREGSWELRILISILRDSGVLTDQEINEVFFSMLHFTHSQQDQVSWAFKTSFLNIGGYDESLRPVPVQPVDNTQNLLDYVEEVKPYRVKTRDFTRSLSPDIDVVPAQVSDFDLPPYYDPETGQYRILRMSSEADKEIIRTQSPWKEWFDNHTKGETDENNWNPNTYNPIRKLDIELEFDRVDHMPIVAEEYFVFAGEYEFSTNADLVGRLLEVRVNGTDLRSRDVNNNGDAFVIVESRVSLTAGDEIHLIVRQGLTEGTIADRVDRFYNPIDAEKNIRAMLGLEPDMVADGGSFDMDEPDYDMAYGLGGEEGTETVSGYGLADPDRTGERPEELVVIGSSESLKIEIDPNIPYEPEEGDNEYFTPRIDYVSVEVPETHQGSSYDIVWGTLNLTHPDNVLVWRNGYRAIPDVDYTLNMLTRTVSINMTMLDGSRVERITVRAVEDTIFKFNNTVFMEANPNNEYYVPFSEIYNGSDRTSIDAVWGDDDAGLRRCYGYNGGTIVIGDDELEMIQPWDELRAPIIITHQTGNEFVNGGWSFWEYATEDGQYNGVNVNNGDALVWATMDGKEINIADAKYTPQYSETTFTVENTGESIHTFPVLSSPYTLQPVFADTDIGVFFNKSTGKITALYRDNSTVAWEYSRQQIIDDFNATHGLSLQNGITIQSVREVNPNTIVVHISSYDTYFSNTFMIYWVYSNTIEHDATTTIRTGFTLSHDNIAMQMHPYSEEILVGFETVLGQPYWLKLPALYSHDGNDWVRNPLWDGGVQNGNSQNWQSTIASASYLFTVQGAMGRNYGSTGGNVVIVPQPENEYGFRAMFYVSRGRCQNSLNGHPYACDWVETVAQTHADGFVGYIDLNFDGTSPTPVVMHTDMFDEHPHTDQRVRRDGVTVETRVNGDERVFSEYLETFRYNYIPYLSDSCLVNFVKMYQGDDAPEGIAFGLKTYIYDFHSGEFKIENTSDIDVSVANFDHIISNAGQANEEYIQFQNPTVVWSPWDKDMIFMFANNRGPVDRVNTYVMSTFANYLPAGIELEYPQVGITVFGDQGGGGSPTFSENTYYMATARPATDLMEAKMVGDYDARPIDYLNHDSGTVGAIGTSYIIRVYNMYVNQTAIEYVYNTTGMLRMGRNADDWGQGSLYAKGSCVVYNGRLYKAIQDVPAGVDPLTQTFWRDEGRPYKLFFTTDARIANEMVTDGQYDCELHDEIEGPLYVQRSDSWEYIRAGDYAYSADYLRTALAADATEVSVSYGGESPRLPTFQAVRKNGDDDTIVEEFEESGVVWVNDERIEFFGIREEIGYYVLTNIRRGTHGTRIGVEQRAITHEIGDGTTTAFTLSGLFTDTRGVEVVLYDAVREADGSPRVMDDYAGFDVYVPQTIGTDVFLTRSGSGITVNFNTAPRAGVRIIIAKTSAAVHPQGSRLIDGRNQYLTRPEYDLGGEVMY